MSEMEKTEKVKVGVMAKREEQLTRFLCDEDCNNCGALHNRQMTLLLNTLLEVYGEGVAEITQYVCPNFTCCADCHIDDFCHMEGCEIEKLAKKFARKFKREQKRAAKK